MQAEAEPEKAELAQDAKASSPADLVAGRLAAAASAAAAAAAPLASNLSCAPLFWSHGSPFVDAGVVRTACVPPAW